MKPGQLDWQKLVFFQKIYSVIEKIASRLQIKQTEKPTCLQYFDASQHITLHVDASQTGLGTAIHWNGEPVAYTSKTLTTTECRYINIQRELWPLWPPLCHYICSQGPWAGNLNLVGAAAHLQWMILYLQSYYFDLTYHLMWDDACLCPVTLSPSASIRN